MKSKEKKLQSVDGVFKDSSDGLLIKISQGGATGWLIPGDDHRDLLRACRESWIESYGDDYVDALHLELPLEFLK